MGRTIGQARNENSNRSRNIKDKRREKNSSFYQTTKWKKVREAYRKKKRAEHEEIILDVYLDNIELNDPDVLIEFMEDEKEYPLSEKSLKDGIIRRANTCDHIIPISIGGSKTDFENLQWLSHSQHSRKTFKENNISYKDINK